MILFTIAITVILTGCGEKKIDGSSQDAFTKSIQILKEGINDDQKEKFEAAMKLIVFDGRKVVELSDTNVMIRRSMDKLNDMTLNEIMIKGKKIGNRRISQKKEATHEKIIELCHKWGDMIIDLDDQIRKDTKSNQANESTDPELYFELQTITKKLQIQKIEKQEKYNEHCLKFDT